MEKETLVKKLNWFYSLELNQVDLYRTQGKHVEPDIRLIFERIAKIEQDHVNNIAAEIHKLGETPSPLGDLIFPIIGSVTGSFLSLTGAQNVLKANIRLEEHATKEYKNLVESLRKDYYPDAELIKVLESNCVDEQLHTAWFSEHLKEIQIH